ncbi:MAG: response regulator [Candidatus Pacebacteria bacterium]|nr:response regulator [Candidatus Paceibacterota bacterium]
MDDNPNNVFVLRGYATSLGVLCDEALNGEDAVKKVVERAESTCCRAYKVIMMDINMPVMDGMQAGAEIASLAEEGKVPEEQTILALTGDEYSAEEEKKLREKARFAAFYVKPIGKKQFTEILNQFYYY